MRQVGNETKIYILDKERNNEKWMSELEKAEMASAF